MTAVSRSGDRTVRVAHVIQNLNYGGMERVLHCLARQLPSHGFEVHVVVLEYYGRFAEGLEESAVLHRVRPMSKLSMIRPTVLADVFREIAPDLVHSHAGVWLKAARASRMAGVPGAVHTDHGRPDPVPLVDRVVDNWASRSTDRIIAVSASLATVLSKQVVHDPTRIQVITNGVDTERLQPTTDRSALREQLDLPRDAAIIGSIGRLEPVKNFGLAIRAFARLPERLADGRSPLLVLAGDGSERPALEQLAVSLKVHERVRFLGWRTDAEDLYPAFDLFTLTSVSEGTSISLLEAMSSGVCPVVTDVGGNSAVLGPDLSSLLVAVDDEAGLAETWNRLLVDSAARIGIGQQCRRRVEAAFSLGRVVDEHVRLYRALLGRTPPGAGRNGS